MLAIRSNIKSILRTYGEIKLLPSRSMSKHYKLEQTKRKSLINFTRKIIIETVITVKTNRKVIKLHILCGTKRSYSLHGITLTA